jgi:hypothetical protein
MLNEECGMRNCFWPLAFDNSTQSVIADLIRKAKIRRGQSPKALERLPIASIQSLNLES